MPKPDSPDTLTHLARRVFFAFLMTFALARIVVYLIMARRLPDLFIHAGGTHLHHLNFGIFLLSAVGAWLLFARPAGRGLAWAATLYGVGMALTFDEFGMWLHLGGSYWQRASWDAVIVVAAGVGLLAYAPALKRFRPRHWSGAVVVALLLALFFYLLVGSLRYAGKRLGPRIQEIEATGPR